jgi:hypothetical protein
VLGISIAVLISTSKNAMPFLLLITTLQQNWRKVQNRFCLEARVERRKGGRLGGRREK